MKTAAIAFAIAACALAAGASRAAAQTCPHPGTVNGIGVLVYCGSAKATVKAGSMTVAWKGGQCKKAAGNFYVNFGDIVTQPTKRAPNSFQIIATATRDGSYTGTTVMMTQSGKSYLGDSLTLTLTHNTKAGTLTGTIEPTLTSGKLAFKATFTC